jgi:hypothetical protein
LKARGAAELVETWFDGELEHRKRALDDGFFEIEKGFVAVAERRVDHRERIRRDVSFAFETYTVAVVSKKFGFTPQVVAVNASIANLDFTARE